MYFEKPTVSCEGERKRESKRMVGGGGGRGEKRDGMIVSLTICC